MINRKEFKKYLLQIKALTERNIKLKLRFKYNLIISLISPFIFVIMPLIILSQLFEFDTQFGNWTINNFLLYQFLAYNIFLLKNIISEFPNQIRIEKFWKTIPSLIIAPLNRINIFFGIFFSHLILIFIPFTIFFIICYLIYPISFFTIISIIVIFLLIALIFSGIGLILGIFAISNENILGILVFIIDLVFWASCITYPFEIFPKILQEVISLNPFYYIFDFLRATWIEDNIISTIILHPSNFYILISITFIVPITSVFIFNKVYKKFGIVGY